MACWTPVSISKELTVKAVWVLHFSQTYIAHFKPYDSAASNMHWQPIERKSHRISHSQELPSFLPPEFSASSLCHHLFYASIWGFGWSGDLFTLNRNEMSQDNAANRKNNPKLQYIHFRYFILIFFSLLYQAGTPSNFTEIK